MCVEHRKDDADRRFTEKCFEQKSVKGIAKSLLVKTLDTA
jgi:hypothetical protein